MKRNNIVDNDLEDSSGPMHDVFSVVVGGDDQDNYNNKSSPIIRDSDPDRDDDDDNDEYSEDDFPPQKQRPTKTHPRRSSPGAINLISSLSKSSSLYNNKNEEHDNNNNVDRERKVQRKLDEMDEEPSYHYMQQQHQQEDNDTSMQQQHKHQQQQQHLAVQLVLGSSSSREDRIDDDNLHHQPPPQQYPGAVSVPGVVPETSRYDSYVSITDPTLDVETENKHQDDDDDEGGSREKEEGTIEISVPNAHIVSDDENIQDAQILAVNVDFNEIDRLRALEEEQQQQQKETAAQKEEEKKARQKKKKKRQRCVVFGGLVLVVGLVVGVVLALLPGDVKPPTAATGQPTESPVVTTRTLLPSYVPSVTTIPTKSPVTITIAIQLDSHSEETSWRLQCDGQGLLVSVPRKTYDNDQNRVKYIDIDVQEGSDCTLTLNDSAGNGINNGFVEVFFGDSVLNDDLLLVQEDGNFTTKKQINFLVVEPPPLLSSSSPTGALGMVDFRPTASPAPSSEAFFVPTSSPAPSTVSYLPPPLPEPIITLAPSPVNKVPLIVVIQLDQYGGETGWNLTCNDDDVIVIQEGTYANLENQRINKTVAVDDGSDCIFSITDSYGDGLGSDDGFYQVYLAIEEDTTTTTTENNKTGTVLLLAEGGGNFGFEEISYFTISDDDDSPTDSPSLLF